jgi:uncharacterized integral membrane protein (TIGR00697 family)
LWLGALFVASLLVADITGVKLFEVSLFGVTVRHTCGMLTFPITFLLTDLINEFYGPRAARRIVWLGLAMGFFAFVAVNAALAMPRWEVPFNLQDGAFEAVFANSRVMYVASLAAYLVGSLLDIAVFGWLKRRTGGRWIGLRATGSTLLSQALDSFVVTWLAFRVGRTLFPTDAAAMPLSDVLTTAATGYALKFGLAIGLTPLVYLGRMVLSRGFGLRPLAVDGRG